MTADGCISCGTALGAAAIATSRGRACDTCAAKPGVRVRTIRLLHRVISDVPLVTRRDTVAGPGEEVARMNRNGAVSVIAQDGAALGVRPAEFEWTCCDFHRECGCGPGWLKACAALVRAVSP